MAFETTRSTETTATVSISPFAMAVMIPDPQVYPDIRHLLSRQIEPFRHVVRERPIYDWRADPSYDPTQDHDDDPDIEAMYAQPEADDDGYVAEERAEESAEGRVEEVDDPELERAREWRRYCEENGIDPDG